MTTHSDTQNENEQTGYTETQNMRSAVTETAGRVTRRQFLLTATVAGSASVAGCTDAFNQSPASELLSEESPTSDTEASRAIGVRLLSAPGGLRKFSFKITHSGSATIQQIIPGIIDDPEFQVAAGGEKTDSARVRAVDLSESVSSFTGSKLLFAIQFDTVVNMGDVNVSKLALINDDGEKIPGEQWEATPYTVNTE